MFVSIGVRALINVEALNMVESVGNVTRHRTVPVVMHMDGRYIVRWVPAISGEALAHRYQVELVKLVKSSDGCKERLDYWSEQGEFLKHFDIVNFYGNDNIKRRLKEWERSLVEMVQKMLAQENKLSYQNIVELERIVVTNSVVEDVAGFLITQGPVKRTSNVAFSYAVPTLDALESGAAQLDVQLQVRHAPQAEALRPGGYQTPVQAPYYVQIASAVYGLTVNLNLGGIGVLSTTGEEVKDDKCPPQIRRRLAIEALEPVLDLDFGAKRSRYNPHGYVELALAVVAKRPIQVSPPTLRFDEFVDGTLERAKELGADRVIAWTTRAEVEQALRRRSFPSDKLVIKRSAAARDFINELVSAVGLAKSP